MTGLDNAVVYELSVDQLDSYEGGEPMFLAVPMNPNIRLGSPPDPAALTRQVCQILPDVSADRIDYVKPGFTFVDLASPKPVQKTSIEDLLGRPISNNDAKNCDFSISVWCVMVSINDGRAHRMRPQFPGGAVLKDGEFFFPRVDMDGTEPSPAKKNHIDPDYFVGDNFGTPE